MNNEKDKMQKSIDEFTEWQDNQYNPGYWIGGIVPNNLLSPRKPKLVGLGLIIVALSLLVPFILLLLAYIQDPWPHPFIEQLYDIIQLVFLGGFALLLLVGGIRIMLKKIKLLNK